MIQSIPAEPIEPVAEYGPAFRHLHLHVLLDLRSRLDRGRLVDAVGGAIAVFPILGCRYERSFWRDRWVPSSQLPASFVTEVEVQQGPEASTVDHVQRGFDLHRGPPLRVALVQHPGGSRLIVSLHHLVGDAASVLSVTHLLLSHLAGKAPAAPVDPDRGCVGPLRTLKVRDLPRLLGGLLREALRPLAMLRVPRRRRGFSMGSSEGKPHWQTLLFDAEEVPRLQEACRRRGATLNDGLVAALACVSADRSDAGSVGAGYTADNRRHLPEWRLQLANLAGVVLFTVRRDCLVDTGLAVAEVARITGGQKNSLLGLPSASLLPLSLGWMPHGFLRIAGIALDRVLDVYFARVLPLTNVGAIDRYLAPMGDDIAGASVVGPFLSRAPAPAIIASGFRGALTLHVCACGYPPDVEMEAYGDEIRRELGTLIGMRPPV